MKKGSSMKVIRALLSTWLLVFSVGAVINNSAKLLADTPDCTPPPAGLVAWWPGEGNAQDIAGGNNGIVSTGLSYTNGEIGQAFLLNNTNAYFHVLASSNL
ncbi:MAG TPA: hypothetical protein VFF11_15375, partial [Candidatus Binatia bacterium]|nr:hypothetical protein [Candidatus Binatia bacterium]